MEISTEAETQPLLTKRTDRKGKVTIAVIALSNLCAWSCISLIAPFFPKEATKKGMNETAIGLVYSCSELVIFLLSPLFGKLLSRNSPRFFYIAGLCVFGCCDVMFGWLNLSPSGTTFVAMCFAVRIVEAIGTTSIMTASYAITGNNFPDRIGTVYGILETVAGCGFLIGPAIGGELYELGGFGLPFWVLGGCVFLCGIASCVVLPPQHAREEMSGPSSLSLLRSPTVWYGIICLVVSLFGAAVWEPVLEQYLEQFDLTQSVIGLIFVIPAVTYTATTPLWGILLDRNVPGTPLTVVGLCSSALCLVFLGPAPFLHISPMLWLTVVAVALLGLCLAPAIVSAMRCIVDGARDLGFQDDGRTFGLVGGIVQSSYCLGTFIGPTVGGALTDAYGFSWTMAVSSLILMLPVICFSPYLVVRARMQRQERYKSQEKTYVVFQKENCKNGHASICQDSVSC